MSRVRLFFLPAATENVRFSACAFHWLDGKSANATWTTSTCIRFHSIESSDPGLPLANCVLPVAIPLPPPMQVFRLLLALSGAASVASFSCTSISSCPRSHAVRAGPGAVRSQHRNARTAALTMSTPPPLALRKEPSARPQRKAALIAAGFAASLLVTVCVCMCMCVFEPPARDEVCFVCVSSREFIVVVAE